MEESVLHRWNVKVRRGRGKQCWIWTGSTSGGYGMLYVEGRLVRAHRLSYEHFVAPIPKGHGVLHTCDNGVCVRPSHLFTGTQADNMRDMHRKGKGCRSLNATQVDRIRKLAASGTSMSDLARTYGVVQTTISDVVHGRSWKEMPGPIQKEGAMKASPEVVAEKRAQLAGACEARRLNKVRAEKQYADNLRSADREFALVIGRARSENVPWNDIVAATGISRQTLGDLVREYVNGKR